MSWAVGGADQRSLELDVEPADGAVLRVGRDQNGRIVSGCQRGKSPAELLRGHRIAQLPGQIGHATMIASRGARSEPRPASRPALRFGRRSAPSARPRPSSVIVSSAAFSRASQAACSRSPSRYRAMLSSSRTRPASRVWTMRWSSATSSSNGRRGEVVRPGRGARSSGWSSVAGRSTRVADGAARDAHLEVVPAATSAGSRMICHRPRRDGVAALQGRRRRERAPRTAGGGQGRRSTVRRSAARWAAVEQLGGPLAGRAQIGRQPRQGPILPARNRGDRHPGGMAAGRGRAVGSGWPGAAPVRDRDFGRRAGVGARRSAAKSARVTSDSWPTPTTTGTGGRTPRARPARR